MQRPIKPIILVVDDEREIRNDLRRCLESCGYEILEADSGRAALEHISDPAIRIDLLIADVVMPAMHGTELLKRAQPIRPEMKAVMISAHSRHILSQLAMIPATTPFLQKPIKPATLSALIDSLLPDPLTVLPP